MVMTAATNSQTFSETLHPRTISYIVPAVPPGALAPNGIAYRTPGAIIGEKRKLANLARIPTREAIIEYVAEHGHWAPLHQARIYLLAMYRTERNRDVDNMLAAFKVVMDVAVEKGIIEADDCNHLQVGTVMSGKHAKGEYPHTIVKFIEDRW